MIASFKGYTWRTDMNKDRAAFRAFGGQSVPDDSCIALGEVLGVEVEWLGRRMRAQRCIHAIS